MESEEITIVRKKNFKQRLADFFANPKKRLIFIICSGFLLIGVFGTGLYLMTHNSENSESNNDDYAIKTSDYQTKYYSSLDGTEISSISDDAYPLAIMVENHVDARPQAGLDKASIVYEAIAEGGITRFMAIFGPKSADKVGPVRSARPYYVDWAMGYNAYYAHVGGNAYALDQISNEKVFDLDQFKYPASYWRDTNLNVSREHTMFTSTIKLRDQATKLNYSSQNNYRHYRFKDIDQADESKGDDADSEENDTVPDLTQDSASSTNLANKININFSSANYNVVFNYDQNNNNYQRVLNNGNSHKDRESKADITPSNLIVMTVNRSPLVTRINEHGYLMDTIGEGKAKIFIDGTVIEGKWEKQSKTEREVFYDNNGNEIIFNRGQFWICVIPPDSTLSYQ